MAHRLQIPKCAKDSAAEQKKGDRSMRYRVRFPRPSASAALVPLAVFFLAAAAGAQTSVQVEMIGRVVPAETTAGAYTLEYQDQDRLFAVEDVRLLGLTHPEGTTGWDKLNEIGRRRILLAGKKEAAETLMAPEAGSRRFVLQGTLYLSNGMLALESVREAAKEGEK
jgi:hypothetical protein